MHSDYRRLEEVLDERGIAAVDGMLADLGVSSMQLDAPGRGFSFRRDEALDMRMDTTARPDGRRGDRRRRRADAGGRDLPVRRGASLAPHRPRRSSGARARPHRDDGQLADVVRRAVPRKGYTRIDPATRTFQAIRIWINQELDGLDAFIGDAARRLSRRANGSHHLPFAGRPDRQAHVRAAAGGGEIGLTMRTKRPVVPGERRVERNPRARSAKLRAAERTEG